MVSRETDGEYAEDENLFFLVKKSNDDVGTIYRYYQRVLARSDWRILQKEKTKNKFFLQGYQYNRVITVIAEQKKAAIIKIYLQPKIDF